MPVDERAVALQRLLKSQPLWNAWTVGEFLGSGSFSFVYAVRNAEGENQALKWIPLPMNSADIDTRRLKRESEESIRSYYNKIALARQDEFQQMMELSASPYVVQCKNFKICQRNEELGFDVLIRMERLTTLDTYIAQRSDFSERDVLRLGIHLSEALERCAALNIIHRDIKPGNIFVGFDSNGDAVYKLGDFGEARSLQDRNTTHSMTGTYSYMAPEVRNFQGYHADVDQYSLGIVLYELVNNRKRPFEPQGVDLSEQQIDEVLFRRWSGNEAIPKPLYCSDGLWAIIKKACAHNPQDRFASSAQMRQALEVLAPESHVLYTNNRQKPETSYIPQKNNSIDNSAVRHSVNAGIQVEEIRFGKTVSTAGQQQQYHQPAHMNPPYVGTPQYSPLTPVAPRTKRKVWLPIALALIVLAGGVFLLIREWPSIGGLLGGLISGTSDITLSVTSVNTNQAHLAVTGASSSDAVRYNAAGLPLNMGISTKAATDTVLAKLIPNSVYSAAVVRSDNVYGKVEFRTDIAVRLADPGFNLLNIGVYEVAKGRENDFARGTLNLAALGGNPVHFKNAPFDEQTVVPILVFDLMVTAGYTDDALPNRLKNNPNLQIVVRQNERVFYTLSRTFSWTVTVVNGTKNYPYSPFYYPLNTLMETVWQQNNGKWPTQPLTLEVYIGGELLNTLPFSIDITT
ncbi:hypothetical protein FACS1894184_05010 [Clostridia bacterium]|nr:hypothetical protein FACS1894184_05010 [Clostridia bacterium]